MIRVLFVCLGNICRSPTAEGIFRDLVKSQGLSTSITTDSAGTAAYHVGAPPDARALAEAQRRGIDMSDLRARQATSEDFATFDYVLAMDTENYRNLQSICPAQHADKLHMFLDFAQNPDHSPDHSPDHNPGQREVPDPFFDDNFAVVFDLIEDAATGLLATIRSQASVT